MLSHEQRIAEVRQRVLKIEGRRRMRRVRLITAGSGLLCLSLILGMSFAMPAAAERAAYYGSGGFEAAASMFAAGSVRGYILIALVAFVLGVCFTVLCFRIRQVQHIRKGDGNAQDRAD